MTHTCGMDLPDDLLHRSPDEGTRRASLTILEAGRRAARRYRKRGEEEALHDLRVAVRRLRTLGRLHARHLQDVLDVSVMGALQKVQRRTGGARDADVQRAWIAGQTFSEAEQAGVDAFVASLAEGTQPKADKAVRQFRALEPALRTGLSWMAVPLFAHLDDEDTYGTVVAGTARRQLAELLCALERIDAPSDAEAIHDARIEGKRLRYVLEPICAHAPGAAPIVARLKELQDLLGSLNDMANLGRAVDEYRLRHGLHDGLDAIQLRSAQHAGAVFATYLERFGTPLALANLTDQIEALARRLDQTRQVEVERKYLLRSVPDEVRTHPVKELVQGYVPGGEIRERLRKIGQGADARYRRTLKAGRGIQRIEVEEDIDEALFEQLWPATAGARVHKRRYTVRVGERSWEIDEFLDRDLVLAEVELTNANAVPAIPAWLQPHLVREVTDESAYVNMNLAK